MASRDGSWSWKPSESNDRRLARRLNGTATSIANFEKRERDRQDTAIESPPISRSPSPPLSPLRAPPLGPWGTLKDLTSSGLESSKVLGIEKFFAAIGVDAHCSYFTHGTKSRIVGMRGQCYVCRREHRNNHWVLINTPGFSTTRIRCHSTGEVVDIKKLDF